MKLYVCGPTVYSEVHIGNMRPILVFDTVANSHKYLGTKVQFIHNITDIDDKIIKAAIDSNVSEKFISEKYTNYYLKMLDQFNINTITDMPKVTEYMDKIIDFINELINNGSAYELSGNVWFDISSDVDYGSISNRDPNQLKFEENDQKKNPGDFALWKKTDEGIKFDSPWGKGRPGWHTECVVFIDSIAEDTLDMHGGGIDLLFPHHENEASQYRVLRNKELTKSWKHVGHLSMSGEKMSKSLGNIIKASDFLVNYDADILRLVFITSNFSAPLNLSQELLESISKKNEQIKKHYFKARLEEVVIERTERSRNIAKLIIDFNFSAFSFELNQVLKSLNKEWNEKEASLLIEIVEMLNLKVATKSISFEDIEMYKNYKKAKKNKLYDISDEFRIHLIKKGLI